MRRAAHGNTPGQRVKLAGFLDNVREVSASLAFAVLRDFYGVTQLVVEDEPC